MQRLEELARELTDALPVACDVTDEASVDALFEVARKRFGRLDVLVNGAGDADPYAAEEEPLAAFADVVRLNLIAAYSVAQHAARPMLAQGSGSIVNIASVLGVVGGGIHPTPGYAASKGGLVNLTRELAVEWAGRGVRVNAIAPAYFESELTAEIFASKKALDAIAHMMPMRRPGRAHELDGPLLFLASDASSYVTGQVLAVDGGFLAK